jgi:hypothetical protein
MAHKKNLIENAFTHSFILELLLEYKYFSHKTRNWLHCSYEVACKKLIEKYGTSNREGIIYYIRENEQEIAEDVYRSLGRSFDTDIYKSGICPLFDGFILETLNSGRNATKKLRTALGIKRQPDLYTYFKERYDAYSVDEVISTIIDIKSNTSPKKCVKSSITDESIMVFLKNTDNWVDSCKDWWGFGRVAFSNLCMKRYGTKSMKDVCSILEKKLKLA